MLALALALLASPVFAGKSERNAESVRLHTEIDRLAQKRAWAGVDRTYAKLVAIKDIEVTTAAHLAGAHAAQERGDIGTAWRRAELAAAAASSPVELEKASGWMADYFVNYGEVSIETSVAYKGRIELVSRDSSFNPVNRVVLDHAQKQLDTARSFRGFLPMGRYSAAGWDFEIIGGPLVKVFVKPGAPPPSTSGTPAPEPAPVPVSNDRMVVLAVRGAAWPANSWGPRSAAVAEKLRAVDGVLAVDAFGPEDPWLVVELDPALVAALPDPDPTAADVAAVLERTLELPHLVVSETKITVPPGAAAVEALTSAVVVGDPPYTLADIARVRAVNDPGPVPVSADTSEVARWRLEVKVTGSPGVLEALIPAANAAEGAEELGLSLEAPRAP